MRPGIVGEVYESMSRRIIVGEFAQGEILTDVGLADQFNASRTPVRDACVHLVQEGFLKAVPGRGYIVTEISLDDVRELYQLRLMLEPSGAELAARSSLPKDFVFTCSKLLEKCEKDCAGRTYEEFLEYGKSDWCIHIEIAKASGNKRLARILSELMNQFRRFQYACFRKSPWLNVAKHEHSAIIEAICVHNASQARQLMYDHVKEGTQRAFQLALFPLSGQDLTLAAPITSLGPTGLPLMRVAD
jgi:DNA-binding GntR family transcriptional regulator